MVIGRYFTPSQVICRKCVNGGSSHSKDAVSGLNIWNEEPLGSFDRAEVRLVYKKLWKEFKI